MENWLLIIVAVIFLIGAVAGYIRGFFKIGLSLVSSLVTVIAMVFLSPYVGDALMKYTPIDEMIEEKCMDMFMPELSADIFEGKDLNGTAFQDLDQDERDNIENEDLGRLGITAEDVLNLIGDIPMAQQIQEIKSADLPDYLKEQLLEDNNSAVYQELGVSNFFEYAVAYVARTIVNILAFLVTFIVAIILVKALMAAVDILGEMPVLDTLDHFSGALLGLIFALLIVWILFLAVTLAYSTTAGKVCFDMIQSSLFLRFLYEYNPLMIKLMSF